MEISGRITKDATVHHLNAQRSVVNFTLAQDTSYTSRDKVRIKRANFFEVGYWGSANVAKLLTKGTAVVLEGDLSQDSYITKSGEFKPVLRFTPKMGGIKILAWRKPGSAERGNQPAETNYSAIPVTTTGAGEDDDLPF